MNNGKVVSFFKTDPGRPLTPPEIEELLDESRRRYRYERQHETLKTIWAVVVFAGLMTAVGVLLIWISTK